MEYWNEICVVVLFFGFFLLADGRSTVFDSFDREKIRLMRLLATTYVVRSTSYD